MASGPYFPNGIRSTAKSSSTLLRFSRKSSSMKQAVQTLVRSCHRVCAAFRQNVGEGTEPLRNLQTGEISDRNSRPSRRWEDFQQTPRSLSDFARPAAKSEDLAQISLRFRRLCLHKLLKLMKILPQTSDFSLKRSKSDRLLVSCHRISLKLAGRKVFQACLPPVGG